MGFFTETLRDIVKNRRKIVFPSGFKLDEKRG